MVQRLQRHSGSDSAVTYYGNAMNEDGTIRIELKDPFWEGPKAMAVFERMNAELGSVK